MAEDDASVDDLSGTAGADNPEDGVDIAVVEVGAVGAVATGGNGVAAAPAVVTVAPARSQGFGGDTIGGGDWPGDM